MHLFPPGIFRLLVLVASAMCFAIGWSISNALVANIGAGLFISIEVAAAFGLYSLAKACELDGLDEAEIIYPRITVISKWVHSLIWVACMFGVALFGQEESSSLFTSAAIVFVGNIFLYAISGLILKFAVGIPVRMGYGGWTVRQHRKRR